MNVTLTPEMDRWLREKTASGFYPSSDEVVREALRLLRGFESVRERRPATLQADVQRGLEGLAGGRSVEWTDAVTEEVLQSGRGRRAV
jgi:putative addiction module CopG family antidote